MINRLNCKVAKYVELVKYYATSYAIISKKNVKLEKLIRNFMQFSRVYLI